MPTFGLPQSIRKDGGGDFTAQVFSHLSRVMESSSESRPQRLRAEPRGCVADGRVALGGSADIVQEISAAVGSICPPRLHGSAGDTRPGVTIQPDTLPCLVRPRRAHNNRKYDSHPGQIGVPRRA